MAVGFSKITNLFGKCRTLFRSNPQISLTYLTETGGQRLIGKSEVFGKNGNKIANVERYTQPCKTVGLIKNGVRMEQDCSTITRKYIPAKGSILANKGVNYVETTRTPFGHGMQAHVKLPNGHGKVLSGQEEIRNYLKLMS